MQTKYIFITGGVVSSLGKGITAAAIGNLLESRDLKIAILKLDPYLNVDPGTMNPFQHGEVYVTDDGTETDLDLGHYYRFTNSPLSKASNATSGQIYESLICKERQGEYLGKTVQVVPHLIEEIIHRIDLCSKQEPNISIVLIEIGGTVGDIECLPFLEAIRQFHFTHLKDCINIHLAYVPYLKSAKEVKTKPAQNSVKILRGIGIIPDILMCRSENTLPLKIKEKLSFFCNVPLDLVFECKDVDHSIYEVPIALHAQNLDTQILSLLHLPELPADLSTWEKMLQRSRRAKHKVSIGIVGKYLEVEDAYKSIYEALQHAAIFHEIDLHITRIPSDESIPEESMPVCDGYLVPGGFGERGWIGKISAAKYCREKNVPFFGICLGMQIMAVEFARNVLGLEKAHSIEVDPTTPHPVISLMEEQKNIHKLGGTMRLGAFPCEIKKDSLAYKAYQKKIVVERHRHRYEFNSDYAQDFTLHGMHFSGKWQNGPLYEIAEIPHLDWMIGVQFHPEFSSKPLSAHPLFTHFLQASKDYGKNCRN